MSCELALILRSTSVPATYAKISHPDKPNPYRRRLRILSALFRETPAQAYTTPPLLLFFILLHLLSILVPLPLLLFLLSFLFERYELSLPLLQLLGLLLPLFLHPLFLNGSLPGLLPQEVLSTLDLQIDLTLLLRRWERRVRLLALVCDLQRYTSLGHIPLLELGKEAVPARYRARVSLTISQSVHHLTGEAPSFPSRHWCGLVRHQSAFSQSCRADQEFSRALSS